MAGGCPDPFLNPIAEVTTTMLARRPAILLATVCLLLLATSSTQAAKPLPKAAPSPQAVKPLLKVLPDGSLGFAIIHDLSATDTKLQKLAQQTQLPGMSPLAMIKAMSGIVRGFDENGSAALVLMPGVGDSNNAGAAIDMKPLRVFFVPTTNYTTFLAALKPETVTPAISKVSVMGTTFLVGNRAGYATFVAEGTGDRQTLQRVLDASGNTLREVQSLEDWLRKKDIAMVVTRRGIKRLADAATHRLDETRQLLATLGGDGKQAASMLTMYDAVFEAIEQSAESFAAGLTFDDKAVRLFDRVQFLPGSEVHELLKQAEPPESNPLAALPNQPYALALGGVMPKYVQRIAADLSARMIEATPELYGLDETQAKQFAALARESMQGIRGISFEMGVGKPGDTLLGDSVVVIHVDDTKQFLADYQKYTEAVNQIAIDSKSPLLTQTAVKPITIDGTAAFEIVTQLPKLATATQQDEQKAMMQKMWGSDTTITAYMAPADDQTIVVAYTNRKALLLGLAAAQGKKSDLPSNKALQQTAALLPADPHGIAFFSPQGTVALANRMIQTLAPKTATPVQLPEFPATPPIGLAVKIVSGDIHGFAVIPTPTLAAIGKYLLKMKASAMKAASE